MSLPAPRSMKTLATADVRVIVSLPAVPLMLLLAADCPISTSAITLGSCDSGIAAGW
jgi:hypothetical protein